jgi:hypothetical protein
MDAQAELAGATGRISVENRRAGRALFVARRLAPGGRVKGSIVLRNTGKRAASLRLTQTVVSSANGRGGASLRDALRLTITEPGRTKAVFDGPVGRLRTRTLRALPVGASRRYTFVASLPRTVDNRYQASSLVVRYKWKATGVVLSGGSPAPAASSRSTPAKRGR